MAAEQFNNRKADLKAVPVEHAAGADVVSCSALFFHLQPRVKGHNVIAASGIVKVAEENGRCTRPWVRTRRMAQRDLRAASINVLPRCPVSLLSQCQVCLQYFSTKGLAGHLASAHPHEAAALARRAAGGKQGKRGAIPASSNTKSGRTAFSGRQRATPQAVALAPEQERDVRSLQAAALLAQRARRDSQGVRNAQTARYIINASVGVLTPVQPEWKQKLASIALIPAHAVHLGPVPPGNAPKLVAPAPIPPPPRPKKKAAVAAPPVQKAQPVHAKPSQANTQAGPVPCTCGGLNERCYRCHGSGYHSKSALQARPGRALARAIATGGGAASFASDGRGGTYGIRSGGQFASMPEHDDYGDESSS